MNNLNIFVDGGARGNPGPAATGVVIKDQNQKTLHRFGKYIGKTTNNQAEYQAVIVALEWLTSHRETIRKSKFKNCKFFLDSTLVVNQLNGNWKVKDASLRQKVIEVRELEGKLGLAVSYTAIPRAKNFEADLLVNQALDEV
ncbi:MAG: Ribonuclease H [Candidatus Beckwithbacteria bacterium GW2011_GWB1_47_15]|uniref:Ribonuclease H n=1 Tax=Candidatus Beckwithbacteria bacterium GW2011_GWB1_47_15 TaxID=1618371 RepID=A0A0G1RXF5_9BACT|nr:MAG: ribonuclease HI, ribonuclease HI [Candidatus Beckwithbacteria bacterium GW2011_GWC1_49_16]AQS30644.1 hypothetical protein [uncultured bacterium]KKU35832.1 MAG: Ribonuclease H [Candidatus Beckwithbacteria bacterium GW2011_GWA1_46_30]KKU61796.1 MAG: Ribonuclease H [Candidatus Beckwithbacteria bacterium GW2011_GWB1_47_15]KKU72650.1 MAG: Ribonuclease H [Candidatus Beckwithbacteria bacterium GW2011_GWA2_47_25]KKW04181.1 MAG: Ribonuclease H [Candidatus Beckwithbacteria bacterium GW2011_GWC2_